MAWARANFLLQDEPRNGGALIFQATDPEAQDPYSASWTADVGAPVGARFQVGSAWRRNFTRGTVLVNPTSSTVTVDVGAQSVTLGPTSGAILRTGAGAKLRRAHWARRTVRATLRHHVQRHLRRHRHAILR
jgi:hypothetical protein